MIFHLNIISHLLNSLKKNKEPEFDYCAGYYCLVNNFFLIFTQHNHLQ